MCTSPTPTRNAGEASRSGFGPPLVLAVVIAGCSIYANLSFAVKDAAQYRFFPPFQANVNVNRNYELGGEYYQIARSLAAGQGFSSPFKEPTGPTAWMPPILPAILAGLLWACDGNRDAVMAVVIFLQVAVLIATGFFVMALARQTGARLGGWTIAAVYFLVLLCHFQQCFQYTHDCWLVLLALDLLIGGLCWWQPLQSWQKASGWGLFGGACMLINPIAGFVWGALSVLLAVQLRAWFAGTITLLAAGLTLLPWTIRNYTTFGRIVPVKSNLAYEFYQSQCLQPDGLIQRTTFAGHPHATAGRERQEYKNLGETAFLDRKWRRFWEVVSRDPGNFIKRIVHRFLGATLWYTPYDRDESSGRPWIFWLSRLTFPLPFLALVGLLIPARQHLHRAQWNVIGAYVLYLLPYIAISYYERYATALLGVKALLVIWGADRLRSSCRRSDPLAPRD